MNLVIRPAIAALAISLLSSPVSAQPVPPYWASISAGEARMRTGPGRQFPAMWLYKRRNLPVKVIKTYPGWRKIEDPDGTQGWMQANLLSNERTGLVTGEVRPLRDKPDSGAAIILKAEPGVVGIITECRRGWCKLNVTGRMGYIETAHIWGLNPGEASR